MSPDIHDIITTRLSLVSKVKDVMISSLNLELEPDELAEDSQLFGFGLGLDSIDALTLIVGIEDAFGVHLPEDMPHVLRSVNTMADFLMEKGVQHAH